MPKTLAIDIFRVVKLRIRPADLPEEPRSVRFQKCGSGSRPMTCEVRGSGISGRRECKVENHQNERHCVLTYFSGVGSGSPISSKLVESRRNPYRVGGLSSQNGTIHDNRCSSWMPVLVDAREGRLVQIDLIWCLGASPAQFPCDSARHHLRISRNVSCSCTYLLSVRTAQRSGQFSASSRVGSRCHPTGPCPEPSTDLACSVSL